MSGQLVGVGMGLKVNNGALEVTEIVPNGPVHKSNKVKLGDILKRVNGKEVGRTVAMARDLLLGPPNTAVSLSMVRREALFGIDAVQIDNSFAVSVLRAAVPKSDDQADVNSTGRRRTPMLIDEEQGSKVTSGVDTSEADEPAGEDAYMRLTSEIQTLRLERETTLGRLDEANDKYRSAMEQARKARDENLLLRVKQAELRAECKQMQDMVGQDDIASKMLSHERGLREELEVRESRLSDQTWALRRALDEAQQDVVRLTQDNIRRTSERDIAREEAHNLQADLSKAKHELETNTGSNSRLLPEPLMADKDSLSRELDRSHAALRALEKDHSEKDAALMQLNTALKESLREAEGQVAESRRREHSLQQENAGLVTRSREAASEGSSALGLARAQAREVEARLATARANEMQQSDQVFDLKEKLHAAQLVIAALRHRLESSSTAAVGEMADKVAKTQEELRLAHVERRELMALVEDLKGAVARAEENARTSMKKQVALEARAADLEQELTSTSGAKSVLQQKLVTAQAIAVTASDERIEMQRKIAAAESDLVQLRSNKSDLEKCLESAEKEVARLTAQESADSLRSSGAQSEADHDLARRAVNAEQELKALQENKANLMQRLSSLQIDNVELGGRAQGLEQCLQSKEDEILAGRAAREELQSRFGVQSAAFEAEKSTLCERVSELESEILLLVKGTTETEELMRGLEKEVACLRVERESLTRKLSGTESSREEKIGQLDEKLRSAQEETAALRTENAALTEKLENIQSSLNLQEVRLRELESDNAGLLAGAERGRRLEEIESVFQQEKRELLDKVQQAEERVSALEHSDRVVSVLDEEVKVLTAEKAKLDRALEDREVQVREWGPFCERLKEDVNRLEEEVTGEVRMRVSIQQELQVAQEKYVQMEREWRKKLGRAEESLLVLQKERDDARDRLDEAELRSAVAEKERHEFSTHSDAIIRAAQERVVQVQAERDSVAADLQSQLRTSQDRAAQLENQVQDANGILAASEQRISDLRGRMMEVEDQYMKLQEEKVGLVDTLSRLEMNLMGAKAEGTELLKRLSSVEEQSRVFESQRDEAEAAVDLFKGDRDLEHTKNKELMEQLEAASARHVQATSLLHEEVGDRDKQIESLGIQLEQASQQHAKIQDRNRADLEQCCVELANMREGLASAAREKADAELRVSSVSAALAEALVGSESLREKLDERERHGALLSNKLLRFETGITEVCCMVQHVSSDVQMLFENGQEADGSEEVARLKDDLEAKNMRLLDEAAKVQELEKRIQLAQTEARDEVERMSQEGETIASMLRDKEEELKRLEGELLAARNASEGLEEELQGARVGKGGSEIEALQRLLEAKTLEIQSLTASAAEGEAVRAEMDVLRQRHVLKQKELLERTQKERAKIAEEMRGAFTELTLRQEKLDASSGLISLLDQEVALFRGIEKSGGIPVHVAHQLSVLDEEAQAFRVKLMHRSTSSHKGSSPTSLARQHHSGAPAHPADLRQPPPQDHKQVVEEGLGSEEDRSASAALRQATSKGVLKRTESEKSKKGVHWDLGAAGFGAERERLQSPRAGRDDTVSL